MEPLQPNCSILNYCDQLHGRKPYKETHDNNYKWIKINVSPSSLMRRGWIKGQNSSESMPASLKIINQKRVSLFQLP